MKLKNIISILNDLPLDCSEFTTVEVIVLGEIAKLVTEAIEVIVIIELVVKVVVEHSQPAWQFISHIEY